MYNSEEINEKSIEVFSRRHLMRRLMDARSSGEPETEVNEEKGSTFGGL